MKEIFIRRSVRKFSNEKVSDEIIKEAIKAGMNAPTALNQRPWEFVVIRNQELKTALSKISRGAIHCENADCVICLLMNKDKLIRKEFVEQDLGACQENMMLELVSHNVGSVWIGCYPLDRHFEAGKIIGIEDNLEVFSLLAIGYPSDIRALHENDFNYDESLIRWL